jgi:hypothetical protein
MASSRHRKQDSISISSSNEVEEVKHENNKHSDNKLCVWLSVTLFLFFAGLMQYKSTIETIQSLPLSQDKAQFQENQDLGGISSKTPVIIMEDQERIKEPEESEKTSHKETNQQTYLSVTVPPRILIDPNFRPVKFDREKCPASVELTGDCIHANNKLPCVKPPTASTKSSKNYGCQRPCGAFGLKLRGAGGVFIREGLLMPLYGGAAFGQGLDESFIVSEGWALDTLQNNAKMDKFDARESVFLTILRHPIDRILSRYW